MPKHLLGVALYAARNRGNPALDFFGNRKGAILPDRALLLIQER